MTTLPFTDHASDDTVLRRQQTRSDPKLGVVVLLLSIISTAMNSSYTCTCTCTVTSLTHDLSRHEEHTQHDGNDELAQRVLVQSLHRCVAAMTVRTYDTPVQRTYAAAITCDVSRNNSITRSTRFMISPAWCGTRITVQDFVSSTHIFVEPRHVTSMTQRPRMIRATHA